MDPERVELGTNVGSYSIDIDVEDLSVSESLTSRYERYSNESGVKTSGVDDTKLVTPRAPDTPATTRP